VEFIVDIFGKIIRFLTPQPPKRLKTTSDVLWIDDEFLKNTSCSSLWGGVGAKYKTYH